jgi:hypothetical protein
MGCVPSAIFFSCDDVTQSMRCHASRFGQASDVVSVDLAPDALGSAGRVALQVGFHIERLAYAIDPSSAKRNVEYRLHCNGLLA